jgi:hypothetical protein
MNNDILVFIIAIIGAIISMKAVPPKWQYLFGIFIGLIAGLVGNVGRFLGQ